MKQITKKNYFKGAPDAVGSVISAVQNVTQKKDEDKEKEQTATAPGATATPNGGTTQTPSQSQTPSQAPQTPQAPEYNSFDYGEYQESDAVKNARENYESYTRDNAPGEYSSAWKNELDGIMKQILNREKFSYDVNSDALYKQYADIYAAQADRAMRDTMAQASALTGGYGSSYAQSVGQQAYSNEMQRVNDIIPELYDRALARYTAEGNDLYNNYGLISAREQEDYAKYRNELSDYTAERDRLYNIAADEYSKDYSRYVSDRDFAYNKHINDRSFDYTLDRDAVSDRQWQESLDYQKDRDAVSDRQWQESLDYQKDRDTVSDRQWQESLDYQKDRDTVSDRQWQAEFDRNGEWYNDQLESSSAVTTYEGEGALNGESVPKALAGVPGLTTANTAYFDENGYFKTASIARYATNDFGETTGVVWNIDGKEVSLQVGVNPYTKSKNPDIANGALENGYQPDNIGGKKLEAAVEHDPSYDYDYINGTRQTIYVEPESGALYIWDDTANEYLDYGGLTLSDGTGTEGTGSGGTGTTGTGTAPTAPTWKFPGASNAVSGAIQNAVANATNGGNGSSGTSMPNGPVKDPTDEELQNAFWDIVKGKYGK